MLTNLQILKQECMITHVIRNFRHDCPLNRFADSFASLVGKIIINKIWFGRAYIERSAISM